MQALVLADLVMPSMRLPLPLSIHLQKPLTVGLERNGRLAICCFAVPLQFCPCPVPNSQATDSNGGILYYP